MFVRIRQASSFKIVMSTFVIAVASVPCGAEPSIDQELATPQATVMAYCKNGIFDPALKYLHLSQEQLRTSKKGTLNWKNCNVFSSAKWETVGAVIIGYKTQLGDWEVGLQVNEMGQAGKWVPQLYSFMLHKYPEGWKIVSYYENGAD